jgi:hypothetical protein
MFCELFFWAINLIYQLCPKKIHFDENSALFGYTFCLMYQQTIDFNAIMFWYPPRSFKWAVLHFLYSTGVEQLNPIRIHQ